MNILEKYHLKGLEKIISYLDAALVTKDPIIFLGESGSGKTTSFHVIHRALGMISQTIDTSKVNVEELYGFPVPIKQTDGTYKMEFCTTPLTVYGKESILLNELSRCKVDVQNQILDIIQERSIQGIPLDSLKYIWADMNPIEYAGSEPLPLATARRFSVIVMFPSYKEMNREDRLLINGVNWRGVQKDDEYVEYIKKIEKIYLTEEKGRKIYSDWRDCFLMNLSEICKYSPNGRQAGFIDRFLAALTAVNRVNGMKKILTEITLEICLMLVPEMVSENPINPDDVQRACLNANKQFLKNKVSDLGLLDSNPTEAFQKVWSTEGLTNFEKNVELEIYWKRMKDHQKYILSAIFANKDDERINEEIAQDMSERLGVLSSANKMTEYIIESKRINGQAKKLDIILERIRTRYGATGKYLSAIISNNTLSVPLDEIIEDFVKIVEFFRKTK
jgi:hypothetical protein